jgi:arabinofuranosyltransferase
MNLTPAFRRHVRSFNTSNRSLLPLRLALLAIVGTLMFRLAWISDDALITLRTALNLWHGWGPGFNAAESVQAYTHPLWFLTWFFLGGISRQWIFINLLMSIALSVIAVALVLWSTRLWKLILAASLLLLSSNAFMEYSTSGLENPMAYLTIGALFMYLKFLSDQRTSRNRDYLIVGLLVSAVLLTRLDLALIIFVPILAVLIRRRASLTSWLLVLSTSTTPLALWSLWSWNNYASFLPNTFAAKRNVNIPMAELIDQGVFYVFFSSRWDLVTPVLILGAVVVTVAWGTAATRPWMVGVVAYLAYVISNGGDFMAGRFLSVAAFVSVAVLIVDLDRRITGRRPSSDRISGLIRAGVAAGITLTIMVPLVVLDRHPLAILPVFGERWTLLDQTYSRGVADERGVWVGWGNRSVFNLWDDLPGQPLVPRHSKV